MSTFQFRRTPNDTPEIEEVVIESIEPETKIPKYLKSPTAEYSQEPQDLGTQEEFVAEAEREYETNKTNPVLVIKIPLKGDLDLDFLNRGAKGAPREIHFQEPGKITHLKNIPHSVQILNCPNQSLKYVDLPRDLVEVNLDQNQIESLDLGKTPKLRSLKANKNRLHSVDNLPASLEHVHLLENPKLMILDLNDPSLISKSLKTVETDPHVVLKNVDDDFVNKIGGGAPTKKKGSEADAPATTATTQEKKAPKISYQDALNRYYEYKSQYEVAVKKFQKAAREKGTKKRPAKYPPCIKCREAVGMTFQRDGNRLSAKCGIGKVYGCDFRMELNTGEFSDLLQDLDFANQEFESNKANLIKMKMDNLFGYEKDENTLKRVQKEMRVFKQNTKYTTVLLEKYRNLLGEDVKKEHEIYKLEREFVEQKVKFEEFLDSYKKDQTNRQLLDAAMEFYVTAIRPTRVKIQELIYPTVDMTVFRVKKDDGFVGNPKQGERMFQSHVVPAEYYSYQIEKPSVLVYQE
jgi:hypothetical protein